MAESKKYYMIRTSMSFEKTVLVPVDMVKDLRGAIDLVDEAVETSDISLFDEEADFTTDIAPSTDESGIREFSEEDANYYQIIGEN